MLEAIRYERGSLSLLEQRLLPGESAWVAVDGPERCHAAIRDMTVRGAPAIAIAAALSLAVELVRGGAGAQFASAAAAAEHVGKQLAFLETSRPTAVNLAIAVKALSALAEEEAGKPGASGASVADAVVAVAEAMLADDAAANRAMGRHGAEALAAAAAAAGRGAPGGGLRVLTHCNTGSLATGAFGTALGVIRTLHEQARGLLAHAYCCETRPYNQGSRLTAYELTHDGLPATLLVDSAAAALMAAGEVDAVVVGADRIAANGDTANKIGTYSHAVAASHHGVPFFIAAATPAQTPPSLLPPPPLPPPAQVTHFRGQRVAAEVDVWNPSFDVTPAALITGIVTEHGLIPKDPGSGTVGTNGSTNGTSGSAYCGGGGGGTAGAAFAVRPWLASLGLLKPPASNGGVDGGTDGAAAPQQEAVAALPPGFRKLDCDSMCDYVAARHVLVQHVGPPEGRGGWKVSEVGDGNINFVYIVEGPIGALCLKQALPFVRVVGESWPLTLDRARIEAEALRAEAALCPEHVPAIFLYDQTSCIIAMQYLAPPHIILRRGLLEGRTYPLLADHLAAFCASTLFHTSALATDSAAFRAAAQRFANTEMCRLTEQARGLLWGRRGAAVARGSLWAGARRRLVPNRHPARVEPDLDADVAALQADAEAKVAAARLKARFIEHAQALLHGDLHTGSFMVTEATTYAIDPEFAYYGPMGFDVGKIIANLLLFFFALDGHASAADPRHAQRAWVLDTVVALWEGFSRRFLALWDEHAAARGELFPAPLFGDGAAAGRRARAVAQAAFMAALWRDCVAFGGAVVIRRLVGIAHVADMDGIADADVRAVCERRALRFGRQVLVAPGLAPGPRELVSLADAFRDDGAQPHFPLRGK
eukprot:scaffold6.g2733.t1